MHYSGKEREREIQLKFCHKHLIVWIIIKAEVYKCVTVKCASIMDNGSTLYTCVYVFQ